MGYDKIGVVKHAVKHFTGAVIGRTIPRTMLCVEISKYDEILVGWSDFFDVFGEAGSIFRNIYSSECQWFFVYNHFNQYIFRYGCTIVW